MELPERKRRILKAIVENYIDTAEPVGSKMLAASLEQSVSSATIRNEMSELEELGYLEKPHVSAGRVPSYAAYRLYVNELMDRHRLASAELEAMRLRMEAKMQELDDIMVSASKVVSEMTRHTAVSMITRSQGETIRKCQLITVDGGRSYAIVLITDTNVVNKMVRLKDPVDPETAAMLCTAVDMALQENRPGDLLPSLARSMGTHTPVYRLTSEVLDFIHRQQESMGAKVYVDGAARLLDNREYQDTRRARELLDYMSDPERLREIIGAEEGGAINIRIGPELDDPGLRDASLVFTTYPIDAHTTGVIGIVAPTRMDYADACAKLAAFTQAVRNMRTPPKQIKENGERE